MTFSYSRRVYLNDTDAAGVVYFAKGLEICHQAYEESLAAAEVSLKQMLREKTIALPIVRAEIDFMRPLVCGDELQIDLSASLISNDEFAIAYQICHADNLSRVLVKAKTTHVCIDPQTRTRTDLPSTILEWLDNSQE